MARRCRQLGRPDAADRVIRIVEELAGRAALESGAHGRPPLHGSTEEQQMDDLCAESSDFFAWLQEWLAALPTLRMEEVVAEAGGPDQVGVFCTDMINAFAHFGRLSGPRVEGIIGPLVALFKRAHALGVRDFVLTQDAHPPDSPEFDAYGQHAMAGSPEAETIPEFTALPFAGLFRVIPKITLDPALGSDLDPWLGRRGLPQVMIACGNCTDLCVYQLAMDLKLRANAARVKRAVIVPASCVQTYDLGVEAAQRLGIAPHPGDLMHALFLYHMHLNNIRVVRAIT